MSTDTTETTETTATSTGTATASGEKPAPLRLGGMALRNGLLIHGPAHWSAACRRKDGTIAVAHGRKPRLSKPVGSVPGARGIARLAEGLIVLPLAKRGLPEISLPWQDRRVAAAAVGASAGAALLRRRLPGRRGEIAAGALSLMPSVVALRSGALAEYHGVEHKAIAAYEQDAGDAREAAKEHDRCGSHLVAPLLAANVAGTALLARLVEEPSAKQAGAVSLAALGVAVELFIWSDRNRGSRAARALRVPGHELQRLLGTREPSEEQLDVGRAALAEILRAEGAAPAS